MKAYVETMPINLGNGYEKYVYKVDYTFMEGDGITCGTIFKTFGVYENKTVAMWVKKNIEDGNIEPIRR